MCLIQKAAYQSRFTRPILFVQFHTHFPLTLEGHKYFAIFKEIKTYYG